uniref:CSC1/OSCA1-like cytosolic domain-containing protein n=1 Tax=Globisporangium ultimum (strain ATCC 200006 / CBS 805.95 / DAOM BR144) TaxID=431595 RepID=K3W946_GLOUD
MNKPRTMSHAASSLDQYDKPSVEVAKKWLETVILPRRFFDEKTNTYRMVEMGEDPTGSELFPVWGTSLRDLYAFGIGIGLYFRMLLQLGLLMFVLAAVSMPSIVYFLSDAYSGPLFERTLDDDTKLDIRIWGTAACTRQTEIVVSGEAMKANSCPVILSQLHVDLIVLVILSLYTVVSGLVQERVKAYIDELEQTAADYSIVVKDPDHDAWSPDEWKEFFSQFGQVKFVTVAVNNHELLSALAHKRYMEEMLRMESSERTVTDAALQRAIDGPLPPPYPSLLKRFCQKFSMFRDLEYWTRELYLERKKIEKFLSHGKYPVWSVFVMFETEEAQRKCIQETQVGVCATIFDFSATALPKEFRFRGTNILHIEQAVEPSSVRWKSVGVRWPKRFSQQMFSLVIVVAMMIGVYYFMRMLKELYVVGDNASEIKRRKNLYILAYALAVTDILGCKILHYVDLLEQHQTKEREQLSMLNKMLLFRVFNGAIVIYLLTDFTDMLSEQNLLQIQAILIANLVTTPVLQLVSVYDRVMQWIYGPLAKTQKKLNQYYSGTYWQLAERYTQITKTVGTALFFKSLIPTGLVITALSLVLNYWVDKYCLLRKWKVPPKYDGLLARASRYHLLFMALTSLIMMGHWYDGWPFDKQTQMEVAKYRTGTHSTFKAYMEYLVQLIFPFERNYQTEEQTEMMRALVLAIVLVTALTIAFLILKSLYRTWNRYVIGLNRGRSSRTKVSSTTVSSLKYLDGYVPSYESWYSDFPYLCVPLHHFEHRFINWSGDHSEYCLVNDVTDDAIFARHLGDRPLELLFGVCKQYDMPTLFI